MLERIGYSDYEGGIAVEAFTDGYAFDEYSRIHLLSVAGHDSSVKAITSALVCGRDLNIRSKNPIEVGYCFGQQYRILSTKLPDGRLHQLVLAEGFLSSGEKQKTLLYVDDGHDAHEQVYEAVRNQCPVPVIPDWSEWLYERLKEKNYLQELNGTKKVLMLNVEEESLDELISDGVKSGEITFG